MPEIGWFFHHYWISLILKCDFGNARDPCLVIQESLFDYRGKAHLFHYKLFEVFFYMHERKSKLSWYNSGLSRSRRMARKGGENQNSAIVTTSLGEMYSTRLFKVGKVKILS
jgi:hypothetical protein